MQPDKTIITQDKVAAILNGDETVIGDDKSFLIDKFIEFLNKRDSLRVDSVRLTSSLEEDFGAEHPDDDPEKSPISLAYDKARKVINKHKREALRDRLYYWTKAENQKLLDFFFHYTAMRDDQHPYTRLTRHLENATYAAITALVAADGLDEASYKLLVEDWRRITGQEL